MKVRERERERKEKMYQECKKVEMKKGQERLEKSAVNIHARY